MKQSIAEQVLRTLLDATSTSRVTLRLDDAAQGWTVDDVLAEARLPDVPSLRGITTINQRGADTARWIERERRLLVQDDTATADPRPPAALLQLYRVRAQILAPLVRDGALAGWISVHDTRAPRRWSRADRAAVNEAVRAIHDELDHG